MYEPNKIEEYYEWYKDEEDDHLSVSFANNRLTYVNYQKAHVSNCTPSRSQWDKVSIGSEYSNSNKEFGCEGRDNG